MQTLTDIERSVKSYILTEFLPGEDPEQLTRDTPLISIGILDSLATLKLVAFLEQEFAVEIAPHEADAENLDSIERIGRLIESKR